MGRLITSLVAIFVSFSLFTGIQTKAAMQDDVVTYAKQFQGVQYKFGGTTPSGFDCSGYVIYVFKKFNINLPRTAADQYRLGTSVSKSNLKAGDMVFFQNTYKAGISHTGIYIGNNNFVSAADDGVNIDSLSNSYWGPHYAGAKRVLPAVQEGYNDVKTSDIGYKAIMTLSNKKVILGYKDSSFRPDEPVTRGQAAAIINRVLKLPTGGATPFKDVSGSSTRFASDISSIKRAGIINGFKDGTFRPEALMTRAEMASIVEQGFDLDKLNVSTASNTYSDINSQYWAYNAIITMNQIDQTKIFDTARYNSVNHASRKVFSAAIYNSMLAN
jgi:hypothetical protein